MKPTHLVAVGDFGIDVANRLMAKIGNGVITVGRNGSLPFPDRWPDARIHILLAGRPVPAMAEAVDEFCHSWRAPWLYVVMDHPYLQVGPLVVPRHSACYRCFYRRWLQHSAKPDQLKILHDHYDRTPQAGPIGYLPSFARMAAAMVQRFLESLNTSEETEFGRVLRLSLLSGQLTAGKVVGVHGCLRCGLGRDERSRSYAELLEDLKTVEPATSVALKGGVSE